MIISRAEIESAVSAYRLARKKRKRVAPSVSFDTYDLYLRSARSVRRANAAASGASNALYRDALVRDLQRRIATGKYHVPAEQIVDKLLVRLGIEAQPA